MRFAYFVLASTALAADSTLCGDWAQLAPGKCSTTNQCCANQNNTASPPACVAPLTQASSSVTSQETYRFAGDGTYSVNLLIATGNSCPLDTTSGTVLFILDTRGTYSIVGNNTDLGGEWKKITYTPKNFSTTIVKSNQASFFTAGQLVGSQYLGPCLKMSDYLNSLDYGCPCNGTWTVGSNRTIDVANCPMVNGTNGSMVSSCPEQFFFNRAVRYGSIRVTNQTNTTRLLELSQPLHDSVDGYNNSVVYATFTANFSCPSVLSPTAAQSSAGAVFANLVLAMVLGLFAL